jgi:hypothetical protein
VEDDMGFLSKLVNKVTGGWAEVTMEVPDAVVRGQRFDVTAEVEVKSEAIDVEGVVIELQCIVMVDSYDADLTDGIKPPDTAKTVHRYEVAVAEAQQLAAGSSSSYAASFEISPGDSASDAEHTWMARTVVRMAGNDPDSRWKTLQVS